MSPVSTRSRRAPLSSSRPSNIHIAKFGSNLPLALHKCRISYLLDMPELLFLYVGINYIHLISYGERKSLDSE